MSAYSNSSNGKEPDSASESPEEKVSLARQLGIGFDGRYYRYRDYRYDRLADAIAYARADQDKSGARPQATPPEWLDPIQPTDAERRLMAEFGIAFDGRSYIYDGYRYDHCKDAANYARLKGARKAGS